jgi:hypothetical protein
MSIGKVYSLLGAFHCIRVGKRYFSLNGKEIIKDPTEAPNVLYVPGISFPFTVAFGFKFRHWLLRIREPDDPHYMWRRKLTEDACSDLGVS